MERSDLRSTEMSLLLWFKSTSTSFTTICSRHNRNGSVHKDNSESQGGCPLECVLSVYLLGKRHAQSVKEEERGEKGLPS